MATISDLKIRETALDLSRSFIVQAPAGSGKTELLIQRFLSLLSKVEQPEQIVCMTFTRKAAGEMRDRIFKALALAHEGQCPAEPHLRNSWDLAVSVLKQDEKQKWNLLNNPGRLKIQTIDSFCAWITGHMPLKSKMGSNLKPEEFSLGAYREAAKNILERIEEESDTGIYARKLLRHLDNNKLDFLKRIQYLLENRDQWLIPFFSSFNLTEVHKELFELSLKDLLTEKLSKVDSQFPKSVKAKLPALLAFSAENRELENPGTPSPLRNISSFPKPEIEFIPQWRELACLLVTSEGKFRKKITKTEGFPADKKGQKEELLEILELLSKTPSLATALRGAQDFPDSAFSDQDWEILEATFQILKPLEDSLREVFRRKEITDFTEVSLSAIHALGEFDRDGNLLPTDLAEYLDYKIQHILVDEYQDTSFKQYELLKRLTAGWQPGDGRSIFIVGDPMQSIFRFRDAEVGIFLKTQHEGIGDLLLEKLTLTTNFRSQEGLVNWVNQCFTEVFPKTENPDLGEISYTPSQAAKGNLDIPGVQCHSMEEGNFEKEAGDVVNLTQRLLKEYPGKSIAILGRAKRHLQLIIRELRNQHITYRAEDLDPLSERWEILDLLSLLQALVKPMDRIAWLSVLRTPWVGLGMEDIHRLTVNALGMPIWSLLTDNKKTEALSEDGRRRIKDFIEVLTPVMTGVPNGSLRDVLEGLWIRLGGPACVPESSIQDIETFFDELEKILDSGDEFNLENFESRLETIYSVASSEECPLQLITMHKAKGLEFDFVILPGLGRTTKPETKRLVFWLPHKSSLLLAPIEETGTESSRLYQFVKGINAQKDISEVSRLLYVAATRAKCQLHLFGHTELKKDGVAPVKGSPLHLLWPYLESHWPVAMEEDASSTETETRPVYDNKLKRFNSTFALPESAPPLPTGRKINLKQAEEPLFEWAGLRARCLGTVLHRCLQTLAEEGFDTNPDVELENWDSRIKSAFMGMGLAQHDLTWATEQCKKALLATLKDKTGQWVLEGHEQAENEYSLTWSKGETIETRILDRTFVDKGIRWIIDYKTGLHEGSDLENFLKNEINRHRPQLEGYERALIEFGETRPIKKAIYHPFYQRLLEV